MRRGCLSVVVALAASTALAGCVGGSSKDTKAEDKASLKRYVRDKPPEILPNTLNINFDGKATLLGYAIEPAGTVAPGQRVKLTMYWRSDKKLDEGWNLFTHIIDGSGERILNVDNVGPLREWLETRQALGPSGWQPGKVYVDEQEFTLPSTIQTDKVQIVVGIWRDNERLKPLSGPHDRENRGLVVTVPTGVSHSPAAKPAADSVDTRVPTLLAPRLKSGIIIDGKLDDAAWLTAKETGPFVNVMTGKVDESSPIGGRVKVLWNDDGMFLGFTVRDPDVRGGFKHYEKDPHLWTKDTVEIMVDPEGDGDNKDYYEIQINPQNLVFDSHFDDYNSPKVEPKGPFGHQIWSARVISAVKVLGTIDKSDDKDVGYIVEARIPWRAFHKAKTLPPKPGSSWRMNFYAMQDNSGVAWSPILGQGNFHKASRFGRVVWSDPALEPAGGSPAGASDAGELGRAPASETGSDAGRETRVLGMKSLRLRETVRSAQALQAPRPKPE